MDSIKVSCIIVTFNAMRWIEKCISSIKEDQIDLEIIVVDNNSSDETVQFIENNFSFVKVFPQTENLGFAGANNLGYKIAKNNKADYIYLLNQDTISYSNNIYQLCMVDKELSSNTGIVSPIHLNNSGGSLDSQFEKYLTAESSPFLISDLLLNKKKNYYKTSFVNAAAWLINIKTIEQVGGLFSTAFYHYGEDVNFMGRLRYFNIDSYIVTNTYIHHCREERKGKKTSEFQKKQILINANIRLYDINTSLKKNIGIVTKYALRELFKGNLKLSIILLFYPIINFFKIKKIRESYLSSDII